MRPWQIRRDFLEEGVILSTVKPVYMAWYGEYETAITFDNQKNWIILKGYNTENEAIKGHEEFLKMNIDELKNLEGL